MRVIDRNGLVYDCRYIRHAAMQDPKYALPKLKKYPLPDRAHIKSAIKFFNYVSPRYEKILAYAILKRMDEYGMSFDDMTIGDNNRFKKYVPKSDHLAHHGILGQRWGKMQGPPYPLGASDHSAAEKKAGWRDSLDSDSKKSDDSQVDSSNKRKGLSDKTKRRIKTGLTIAGTVLAAYGVYKLSQTGTLKGMTQRGKDLADFHIGDIESLKKINPNFSQGQMYQMNCGNCTIANELMKRGMQGVSAGPNLGGMTVEQMKSYFDLKPGSVISASDGFGLRDYADYVSKTGSYLEAARKRSKDFTDALSKMLLKRYPEGSRGNVMIPTSMGSHWISWKVMPGGKINFENPQDPSFNLQEFFATYKHCSDSACQLTAIRLDNAGFDMKRAHEVINTSARQAEVFNTFKKKK